MLFNAHILAALTNEWCCAAKLEIKLNVEEKECMYIVCRPSFKVNEESHCKLSNTR